MLWGMCQRWLPIYLPRRVDIPHNCGMVPFHQLPASGSFHSATVGVGSQKGALRSARRTGMFAVKRVDPRIYI
jgi:hypothetical protein